MFIKCYANSAIFYFLSPFKASSSGFSAKYGSKKYLWKYPLAKTDKRTAFLC